MHVITFSVSIFFGFSPGIIVMASCLPFAFSRLPLWAIISSFYHYTSKGKDKNKGQDGQRKVRQHFSCFLVSVDGIKLSYRATLKKTGYACLSAVVILVMPAASPSLELATLLFLKTKKGNFSACSWLVVSLKVLVRVRRDVRNVTIDVIEIPTKPQLSWNIR